MTRFAGCGRPCHQSQLRDASAAIAWTARASREAGLSVVTGAEGTEPPFVQNVTLQRVCLRGYRRRYPRFWQPGRHGRGSCPGFAVGAGRAAAARCGLRAGTGTRGANGQMAGQRWPGSCSCTRPARIPVPSSPRPARRSRRKRPRSSIGPGSPPVGPRVGGRQEAPGRRPRCALGCWVRAAAGCARVC